jgi:hypothetical protein
MRAATATAATHALLPTTITPTICYHCYHVIQPSRRTVFLIDIVLLMMLLIMIIPMTMTMMITTTLTPIRLPVAAMVSTLTIYIEVLLMFLIAIHNITTYLMDLM